MHQRYQSVGKSMWERAGEVYEKTWEAWQYGKKCTGAPGWEKAREA